MDNGKTLSLPAMSWMIYGANGFTGALIAREAVRRGMAPVLAGRSAARLAPLAQELALPMRAFPVEQPALEGIGLVLNCAGPFSRTAAPMMRECLATGAHYLDITGEIDVLDAVHGLDDAAKAAGVVLCPGVGFDVVPTDCVALMLKQALPEANALVLGFDAGQAMSPGTAKTMVEYAGAGGKIRRGGRILPQKTGSGIKTMDFGRGPVAAMPVPWGDVASAWYTTGIPDITVFTPAPFPLRMAMRALSWAGRSAAVTGWLTRRIEAGVKGPDEAMRRRSPAFVYGQVTAPGGAMREMRIKTLNGYSLTVVSALAVVERLLAGAPATGALTPARLMGADFVLTLPGTSTI